MNAIRVIAMSLAFACSCYAQQGVFAQRFLLDDLPDPEAPVRIGTIPGTPGMYIHVLEVGIGGEPDAFSGPTIFGGIGSGLEFTWGAGQETFTATYLLAPTMPVFGPPGARGFTCQTVSLYTTEFGDPLDVWALSSRDSDGLFTYAADSRGTFFDDSAYPGSSRVWLSYEYTLVPEPSTWALFSLAVLGLGAGRWVQRRR